MSQTIAATLPAGLPVVSVRQMKKFEKDPRQTAIAAGLNYVNGSSTTGYFRKGKAPRFYYVDQNASRCTDKVIIKKIKSLVIPPAWKNVWISKDPNAHLLVTGIDEAGRKQYRYHPFWNLIRNQAKFYRLLMFSEALPQLREQVESDLRKHDFSMDKAMALIIKLMDKTSIRVGNLQYKLKYGSSGITTLDSRNVTVKGKSVQFVFKGKKGVKQDITIRDESLARQISKFKELPGKRLFQYIKEDGQRSALSASDINNYIKKHTCGNFSAKDFRTWVGSVVAFQYLSEKPEFKTKTEFTRTVNTCLDAVAARLGNTRTVCRNYYVHPAVLRCYETSKMHKIVSAEVAEMKYLSESEQRLKMLLARSSVA